MKEFDDMDIFDNKLFDFNLWDSPKKEYATPLEAIRAKCLDCAGFLKLVKSCLFNECPLYQYRCELKSYKKKENQKLIGNFKS